MFQVMVKRSEPLPMQAPATHAWMLLHAMPQPPQLLVLVSVSRQVPPQLV
jgi:hypothetical protein